MSSAVSPTYQTAGPAGWINLPDVAEKLDVSISKVHQMIRDGALLAVRRDGIRVVPAELVANSTVLKHLPGVLTLLRDSGYNDEEALRWLYEPDESVDGCGAKGLGGVPSNNDGIAGVAQKILSMN